MGFHGDSSASSSTEVILTELPSLEVISKVHHGSFERFADAYLALMNWIKREGFVVSGAVREVYIHVDQDEEKNVSELQIPVCKS
jgi:effector-binding domain-containing protein